MVPGDDTNDPMLALVRAPVDVGAALPGQPSPSVEVQGVPVQAVPVDADHDLVVRARQGDQAAFAQLFTKHHGRVYGMCARLLSRKPDVDDAVQQTFLEAWRCLHRFEGKSRFTTWLTRIAIHTCFGFRRKMRRLLLLDDLLPNGAGGSGAGGESRMLSVIDGGVSDPRVEQAPLPADEMASRRARSRALDEVLQQLSEKKRVVFVLADLEELTSPEVAEILGIPEATVRTRLFYARKEIATLLRGHKGFVDVERFSRAEPADPKAPKGSAP